MCGLVGVISSNNLIQEDRKFFSQALFADRFRGQDSTGILAVNHVDGYETEIFKKAYPAEDFLQLRGAEDIINKPSKFSAMVGHNRASTKGATNHYNAHPFEKGNVTLVHNGTLKSYNQLPGWTANEVDSRLLCQGISELGVDETIDRITGAYALIWYNRADGTMSLLRNSERTLYLAYNMNKTRLYFASEKGMLDWILDRNGIKHQESFLLPQDQLHIFDLSDKVLAPEIREVKKEVKLVSKKVHVSKSLFTGTNGGGTKAPAKPEDIPLKGESVEVIVYNFEPYQSSKPGAWRGYLEGTLAEPPFSCVEVHGIDPCSIDSQWNVGDLLQGLYDVDVTSTSYLAKASRWTVYGENPEMIEDLGLPMEEVRPLTSGSAISTGSNVMQLPPPASETNVDEGTPPWVEGSKPDPLEDDEPFSTVERDDYYGTTIDDLIEDGKIMGPDRKFIDFKSYQELTKYGCASCSCNLTEADAEKITWKDCMTPICDACEAELFHENVIKMH